MNSAFSVRLPEQCEGMCANVRSMCLSAAVGGKQKNVREDVRTVQLLLNLNSPQVAGPLVPDGVCGPGTVAAIELFQHGVVGHTDPSGVVLPDGSTLKALRAGMPPGLIPEKLQGILVHAASANVLRFFAAIMQAMHDSAMDTPLRQAHFLAQIAHESGELQYTEELASGKAYEGRKDLGNTQPGDGPRFKGRGLIQLTGRANYAAYGKEIGTDLTSGDSMNLVSSNPALAVGVAAWFWTKHDLNTLADVDDVRAITRKINGGFNGLPDRQAKLERAKFFLLPLHGNNTDTVLIRAMEAVAAER